MSDGSIVLPESMKIDALEHCRPLMDEALAAGQSVTLDGSQVAGIDYSGVQLLVAFVSQLKSLGLSMQWAESSETLKAAAVDLAADSSLGL